MNEPKTFSTQDLDAIGISRLRSYVERRGWQRDYSAQKLGTYCYRAVNKPDYSIYFCDSVFGDYYQRFAEAIADLARAEGKSLVRMYLTLALGI